MLPAAFLGDAFLADTFTPAMQQDNIRNVDADLALKARMSLARVWDHGSSKGVRDGAATGTCLLLGSLGRPLLPRLGC